jgi:tripartite-type tricarboxylate transporter receptor subunit TctC
MTSVPSVRGWSRTLRVLAWTCAFALSHGVCTAVPAADAGAYPVRPIRLLVPFPPGGGADTLSRIVTPKLSAALGQQWVIDNRGGAAGNIATETVAKAAPDGYTLLLDFSTALTVNPSLYKLPFDVIKDLQPIALLAGAQYMLVVHPSVKADNIKEFIELVKANPGKLNYASAGVGSPLHLAAELFKYRGGLNIVHVPYKGGGPAAAAVLGGEAQVLFGSFASSYPHVKSGRLKGLAVTGLKRSPVAPEIPYHCRICVSRLRRQLMVRPICARKDAGQHHHATEYRSAEGAATARRAGSIVPPGTGRDTQGAARVCRSNPQ